MLRRVAAAAVVVLGGFLGACGGGAAFRTTAPDSHPSSVPAGACEPTPVHYRPHPGVQAGLRGLPWIAPAPTSAGAVGHLFYYPHTPWRRRRLSGLRIWTGGHGPVTDVETKILWISYRRPITGGMVVRGRRVGRPGRFTQRLDFGPSIVDVPAPGCWRLTLQTRSLRLHVTLRAVRPER